MNRSTTGKGSKSKLVWNDEFDSREFKVPTERFLSGLHLTADRLVEQLPEHQRFIDHYCKARA